MSSDSASRVHGRARSIIIAVLGVTLVLLAGFFVLGQRALAGEATTQSTIPPGGTIPPPSNTIPPLPGGSGFINFLHLALFDSNPANTGVDICTDTGLPVPGAQDITYGEQTGYLQAPVATYDLKVTVAGSACATQLLNLAPFSIRNGQTLTIILFGDGVVQPLSIVTIVENAGQYPMYLPLVGKRP